MRSHSLIRSVFSPVTCAPPGMSGAMAIRVGAVSGMLSMFTSPLKWPHFTAGGPVIVVVWSSSSDSSAEHLADLKESVVTLGARLSKVDEGHRSAMNSCKGCVVGRSRRISFDSYNSRLVWLARHVKSPVIVSLDGDSESEHFPQSDIDIGPADELALDDDLKSGRQTRTNQEESRQVLT